MDKRAQIHDLVRQYPGLHLRALARQADTSLHLVQYHAQALSEAGDIDLALDGGKLRAFPPGLGLVQRRILGALREPKRAAIMLHLLNQPCHHGVLARALKVGKSTLSFHVQYLQDAELISREKVLNLEQPDVVEEILQTYPETPDAADRLGSVWSSLYRG